jgi:hypothetical protein
MFDRPDIRAGQWWLKYAASKPEGYRPLEDNGIEGKELSIPIFLPQIFCTHTEIHLIMQLPAKCQSWNPGYPVDSRH